MAKEKAWYADSAVGTLLADLFEGNGPPNCSHSLPRSRSLKRSGVRSPAVRLPPGGNAGSVWWSASKPTRRRARFCWLGPPAPASNRFCGWLRMGKGLGRWKRCWGWD